MDASSTNRGRHSFHRGSNTNKEPVISHPPANPQTHPRNTTPERSDLGNTNRFSHHPSADAYELTSDLRNAHLRSSATRGRASEPPALSPRLTEFSELKDRPICAAYCKQHHGVWRENADDLRIRAIEALRRDHYSNAQILAERWLMLARARRMDLTSDEACDWLFRVAQGGDSAIGFDQDLDDLMIILTDAAKGPEPGSSSMKSTAAARPVGFSRSNVQPSSSAAIPINSRSSNPLLIEPGRAVRLASSPSLLSRSTDFSTHRNIGVQQFDMASNVLIGNLPHTYAAEEPSSSPQQDTMAFSMGNFNLHGGLERSTFLPPEASLSSRLQLTCHSTDNRHSLDQSTAETTSTLLSEVNTIESMTLGGNEREIEPETEELGPKLWYLTGLDPEKADELHTSYYVRKDREAREFFVRGRVFGMVWHENAGTTRGPNNKKVFRPPNQTSVSQKLEKPFHTHTITTDGTRIFSHIRRFVIVKARHGYCWAIPINSYGGYGLSRKKMSPREQNAHTIIYDIQKKPQRIQGEPIFDKSPIAVRMTAGETLTNTSRLHFDKPQSIDWNIKVKDIGMITGAVHARNLIAYFQLEFKREEDTTTSAEEE